jgi:hypothetical protein
VTRRPILSGNPITGIADCCARAASGQATAEPPRSAMNFRRLMGFPSCRDSGRDEAITFEGDACCASQQIWRPMSQMGHNRWLPHRNIDGRFTSVNRHTDSRVLPVLPAAARLTRYATAISTSTAAPKKRGGEGSTITAQLFVARALTDPCQRTNVRRPTPAPASAIAEV